MHATASPISLYSYFAFVIYVNAKLILQLIIPYPTQPKMFSVFNKYWIEAGQVCWLQNIITPAISSHPIKDIIFKKQQAKTKQPPHAIGYADQGCAFFRSCV